MNRFYTAKFHPPLAIPFGHLATKRKSALFIGRKFFNLVNYIL